MRQAPQGCQARLVRQMRHVLHARQVCHAIQPRQVRLVRSARKVRQVRQRTSHHASQPRGQVNLFLRVPACERSHEIFWRT